MPKVKFANLVGRTLEKVERQKSRYGDSDEILFTAKGGHTVWRMYHSNDCCEHVDIEEVIGDFQDLIGTPILKSTEHANQEKPPKDAKYDDLWRWTFYDLSTIKGTVTIRWYGASNGYYGVAVDLKRIKGPGADDRDEGY